MIKILKDTKVKFLQSNLLLLENTCAFAFSTIQNILGRHFLGSFCALSLQHFDEIDVRKIRSLQNRFNLRKEKKVTRGQIGGIGGCSKVAMFLSARN